MAQSDSNGIIFGKSNAGHSAVVSKTAYEGAVIARAIERSGHNPHLKGHIHEILVKDARNARNQFTLNGNSTELTTSTTAGTVYLVTTKGSVSGAAAGAVTTATGAGAVAAVSALGMTGMAATAVTIGAPLAVTVGVGYVASEIFD